MAEFTLMTFDEDGFPVEVHGQGDCERAVARGAVGPDTEITVYDADRKVRRMRAAQAPVFDALFTPAAPSARAPAADPLAEAPMPVLPPSAPPKTVTPPPPPPPQTQTAKSAVEPPAPPRPRRYDGGYASRSSGGGGGALAWAVAVAAVLLVAILIWTNSRSSSPQPATAVATNTVTDNMEAAADNMMEAPVPQTFYTVRDVELTSAARAGSAMATVARGTSLIGNLVAAAIGNGQWLEISDGPHAGLFVWQGNLSAVRRPTLDRALAGSRVIASAVTMTTEPAESSEPAAGSDAVLAVGATVELAGTVRGDWAEVLRAEGGVGYIPVSALQPLEEATTETSPPDAADTDTHQVWVRNRCANTLRFGLLYRDGSGWQSNGGAIWKIGGGGSFYPAVNSVRIRAVGTQMYLASFDDAGVAQAAGDGAVTLAYGSDQIEMRRAIVTQATDGDYEIGLDC